MGNSNIVTGDQYVNIGLLFLRIIIKNNIKMERYIVLDSTGHKVGMPFRKWKEASIYKTIYGRQDWRIKRVDNL